MKKTIYLNFNLDNPLDLEMYNLLEGLGRNKKSIIQFALMNNGWLSGCHNTEISSRGFPKMVSQKKVPVKKQSFLQEQVIKVSEPISQPVPIVSSPEEILNISSHREEKISAIQEQNYKPVGDNKNDIEKEQIETISNQIIDSEFPSVGQRYFSSEQISMIKTIPSINISFFEDEKFCQAMKDELGDSTEKSNIKDAYTEASWSN